VREELEGLPQVLSRGGIMIVAPMGQVLAWPL
jgi:hypothetical protein